MVHLSHLYMTTGKIITLTIQIFVGKVMSLLFNTNFHNSSVDKESAYNIGDLGSIPGLGRSPGEANGYPLQYSCLKNASPVVTVHKAAKSWTRLSD